MKKTILAWFGVAFMSWHVCGAVGAPQPEPCDSLFLSNGRVVAVKHLNLGKETISFSYCDDPSDRVFTAPWRQIVRIKKGDGSVVETREITGMPSAAEKTEMDKKADALVQLSWLSLALVLVGIGFFLAPVVFFMGMRLLKKLNAEGHPNRAVLRKRIIRAMALAGALSFVFLVMAGAIIYTIAKLIQGYSAH